MRQAIIGLLMAIQLYSCSEYKVFHCKEGENRQVPRHPSKEYKKSQREIDVNFKGTINILNKISTAPIEIGVKNKIVEFREKLNNETIMYESMMRKYQEMTFAYPCNEEYSKRFISFLELMRRDYSHLQELRAILLSTFGMTSDSSFSKAKFVTIENINIIINNFDSNFDPINNQIINIENSPQEEPKRDSTNVSKSPQSKGNICFRNNSMSNGFGTKRVIAYKNNVKIKEMSMSGQSSECFYNLPTGVYKIEIYYIGATSGQLTLKENYEVLLGDGDSIQKTIEQ